MHYCNEYMGELRKLEEKYKKDVENNTHEGIKYLSKIWLDFFDDIREELKGWDYCDCYTARDIRPIKNLLEKNKEKHEKGDISPQLLEIQYNIIRERIRGDID